MNKMLRGVGVALVTPFKNTGEVDYESLKRLIDSVTIGGVDYLVVMGTTAENPTLSLDEQQQILAFVLQNNSKGLPIVMGVGGNCTAEVIHRLRTMDLKDVAAVLSVVPYYNKPNQDGIFAHFTEVLKASPLPVLLYNVPGRTGVNMAAHTTLRLAREYPSKAIGVKEASGNLSQAAMILRDAPADFLVISGDDNLTLAMIAMGGHGVISVSANCFAEAFCQMVHAAQDGRYDEAATLNLKLHEATEMLFEQGNPVGVKAVLAIKGIIGNNLRLPLVPASDQLIERLQGQIKKYNI